MMAIVGFYLISAVFGYAATLMQHLRSAGDDLADAHRDLEVIHDLTTSLQSAADVNEVEERVLEAVTTELNFERAVVALVDEDERTITAWVGRARQGPVSRKLPHSAQLPLSAEGGVVSQAQVCVEVTSERAILSIRDNGNGFEPDQVLKRVYGREHFGLRGMQERARSLGGACEINSQPGAGSTVMVDIPLSDRQEDDEIKEEPIPLSTS
jgi:nitrate/nitrite-specific signal transduction histidine kinase